MHLPKEKIYYNFKNVKISSQKLFTKFTKNQNGTETAKDFSGALRASLPTDESGSWEDATLNHEIRESYVSLQMEACGTSVTRGYDRVESVTHSLNESMTGWSDGHLLHFIKCHIHNDHFQLISHLLFKLQIQFSLSNTTISNIHWKIKETNSDNKKSEN